MKVWTCNTFEGYWPVGSAAVVVAHTEYIARDLLDRQLKRMNLPGLNDEDVLQSLDVEHVGVHVLWDGNY